MISIRVTYRGSHDLHKGSHDLHTGHLQGSHDLHKGSHDLHTGHLQGSHDLHKGSHDLHTESHDNHMISIWVIYRRSHVLISGGSHDLHRDMIMILIVPEVPYP